MQIESLVLGGQYTKHCCVKLLGTNLLPNCWAVICVDRKTEVLMARDRNLFYIDEQQCINVKPADITHEYTAILEMAVSLNGEHVVLFTDGGYLWMGSANLQNRYIKYKFKKKINHQRYVVDTAKLKLIVELALANWRGAVRKRS